MARFLAVLIVGVPVVIILSYWFYLLAKKIKREFFTEKEDKI